VRAPRRRNRARQDLVIAGLLVLALVGSEAVGMATAAVLAIALLALRTAWMLATAVLRRAPRGRRDLRRQRAVGRRGLRVATMASLIMVPIAGFSYAQAVTAPSNSALAIRSVEWLRDNGAGSIVSAVEGWVYTATAPSTGGPALTRLPDAAAVGPTAPGGGSTAPAYRPPDVPAAIHPRLPGEGVWHTTRKAGGAAATAVMTTTIRPDPSYPRVVAGLARIDPRHARVELYTGLKEPAGPGPRGAAHVPASRLANLLAVFNSGFKHVDSGGGYFAGGNLYAPLRKGQATFVGTTSGGLDVRSWSGGSRPGPGIAFARQNLPLIVSAGRLNPTLGDSSKWGTTVGNNVLVWRSGIGIDRRGDLIYAAANYQSARGLARILIRAGAVRAMELDINSYWVTLNVFGKPGGGDPRKLLPDMNRPATRYLSADDRDFFGVYAR
jgi:hypothetical protein